MTGRQWAGLALMGVGVILALIGVMGLMAPDDGVAEASPSVSMSAEPSLTPEPTPSPTPTPTPVPTPEPLGEADVRAFVDELVAAINTGDVEFLVANLHPATIDRYGEEACRTATAGFTNPDFDIEVLEVAAQAPWDYVTEDPPNALTTTIADTWEVTGNLHVGGTVPDATRAFHYAPFDGTVRWFTDCGTPLS
jgi:hypothetical protein